MDFVPSQKTKAFCHVSNRTHLFKARQHQHTVFHLRYAKSCNAENFAPIRHEVGQKLQVPGIHFNTVFSHREIDLFYDDISSGFYAKGLLHFDDMIC